MPSKPPSRDHRSSRKDPISYPRGESSSPQPFFRLKLIGAIVSAAAALPAAWYTYSKIKDTSSEYEKQIEAKLSAERERSANLSDQLNKKMTQVDQLTNQVKDLQRKLSEANNDLAVCRTPKTTQMDQPTNQVKELEAKLSEAKKDLAACRTTKKAQRQSESN
jgi:septal ring factor EnvC (AmiA/AmiB activator)